MEVISIICVVSLIYIIITGQKEINDIKYFFDCKKFFVYLHSMDIHTFIDEICKANNLDVDKLKSNYRQPPYQDIRRIAIYALNDKFDMIPNRIKEFMNKKSHSSIIKSIQVHEDLIKFNKKYRELYEVNIKILG